MSYNPGNLIMGAGSIFSGIEQNKEAKRQAEQQQKETGMAVADKLRQAEKFKERQQFEFLESGVLLEGSPLMVLKETMDEVNREVKSMRQIGFAKEESLRRRGQSALTSGVIQGTGQIASGARM